VTRSANTSLQRPVLLAIGPPALMGVVVVGIERAITPSWSCTDSQAACQSRRCRDRQRTRTHSAEAATGSHAQRGPPQHGTDQPGSSAESASDLIKALAALGQAARVLAALRAAPPSLSLLDLVASVGASTPRAAISFVEVVKVPPTQFLADLRRT
jgi:hypothetical protein